MRRINHHLAGHGSCIDSCCLKIEKLNVNLSGQEVLTDVSFHLHCGEIVALIGPNGAGKSSLIKSILGQLPYSGSITFSKPGGIRQRPKIGYVPQSPVFDRNDPVSVFDFFCACLYRRPVCLAGTEKQKQRVISCLSRVHAEKLINRRIGALSGGELQRVLLALALEPIPEILILDEPLSGVDIEGETQLMDMLDDIRRQYDLSILYSTHDFTTLSEYADRVILLNSRILISGTPDFVLASDEFRDTFHLNVFKEHGRE